MTQEEILEYLEKNHNATIEDIFYGEYKDESFEFGKSLLANIILQLIENKNDTKRNIKFLERKQEYITNLKLDI